MRIDHGELVIETEGALKKFVEQVEQRTFSGRQAVADRKRVLYVTERCVFTLTGDGLTLTEVAPGIDIEKDVLAQMGFTPLVPHEPSLMDARLFAEQAMNLRIDLLATPIADRFQLDADAGRFFVDFEGLAVRSQHDIEEIRTSVERLLQPLGRRVVAVVNYDNFSITPELTRPYVAMVQTLVDRFYSDATRYTSSAFLRARLRDALTDSAVVPNLFETRAAAEARLHRRTGDVAL